MKMVKEVISKVESPEVPDGYHPATDEELDCMPEGYRFADGDGPLWHDNVGGYIGRPVPHDIREERFFICPDVYRYWMREFGWNSFYINNHPIEGETHRWLCIAPNIQGTREFFPPLETRYITEITEREYDYLLSRPKNAVSFRLPKEGDGIINTLKEEYTANLDYVEDGFLSGRRWILSKEEKYIYADVKVDDDFDHVYDNPFSGVSGEPVSCAIDNEWFEEYEYDGDAKFYPRLRPVALFANKIVHPVRVKFRNPKYQGE